MASLGDTDFVFTATNQTVLTATAPLIVSAATVLNTDTTNRSLWLSRVSSIGGATLVVSGSGASAFKVAPGQTAPLPLSGFVLSIGENFTGRASATNVLNISLSYVIPS